MLSLSITILPFFFSATIFTALTIISAIFGETSPADLPDIEVITIFFNVSSSSKSIGMATSSKIFKASSSAILKPLTIKVGCISCSNRLSAFFNNSPAITTLVVVPSPTSSFCVFATSTIILAAGCSISISSKIVTPSFVMTISPIESTSILSIPFGPRVVLTASATALAAAILFF